MKLSSLSGLPGPSIDYTILYYIDDIYLGHINTSTHLIIASEESLWAIDKKSRKPWCFSWEEISHFTMLKDGVMRITIFSQVGLKAYSFKVENTRSFAELNQLLLMQAGKMVSLTLCFY